MIRAALPSEAELLRQIHKGSVEQGCAGIYTAEQIDAWTSANTEGWARIVADSPLFIVYELEGSIVGFASLRKSHAIWQLYVSPGHMGQGIGSQLLARLEDEVHRKGMSQVTVEASLNAVPFYERRQYQKKGRRTLCLNGVEIEAVDMVKVLPP